MSHSPEQSDAAFALYKLLDLGDHIGARGFLFRTAPANSTVHVSAISLAGHQASRAHFLAKAMLALPDSSTARRHELRYRSVCGPLAIPMSAMSSSSAPHSARHWRKFFDARGYLEANPMMPDHRRRRGGEALQDGITMPLV